VLPHLPYVATVYNGIRLDEFSFNDSPEDYLVFVGRIHPDKGVHLAIEAARAAGRQMIAQGGGGAIVSVIASYAWTGGPGTVHSAAANAENNYDMTKEALVVVRAFADNGPTIKRFRPRPQGRAVPILKRSSNITVVVDER